MHISRNIANGPKCNN